MSPGGGTAICACVGGADAGRRQRRAATGTGGARAPPAAGGVWPCPGSRWNSTKLIACGSPSSVTVKSFAVSPSIGLPSLSFTRDGLHDQPRAGAEGRAVVLGRLLPCGATQRTATRQHTKRPPRGHEGRRDSVLGSSVVSACLRGCISMLPRTSTADSSASSASCSRDSAGRTAGCRRSCSRRNR